MQLNLGLIVFVVVLVAVFGTVGKGRAKVGRIVAKPLMTQREIAFWHLLRVAADPLHVAPQVAMGALLRAAGGERQRATRNRFDRKIVDFVLLDDDGGVRLLIELDDRTHHAGRDAIRDKMVSSAGYKPLRVNGATARDLHLLKAKVDEELGISMSWSPPSFSPATSPHRARNMSARPSTPRA